MNARNRRPMAPLAALVAMSIAAPAGSTPPATGSTMLNVFAAASLADAFGDIARDFEQAHPGTRVQLNLAGSQQLATQIEQGAAADVFASADDRWMDYAREHQLIQGDARAFAHNRLIVIVPKTNSARIHRLQDLAKPGVKLVLGAESVPVGRYSRELLQNLGRLPGFDATYSKRVLANLASEEESVRALVSRVQLGEADAGICYVSDVTPATQRYIKTIAVPDSANVLATYPIAVVTASTRTHLAGDFIERVLSPEGQKALERHGLMSAKPATP